MREGYPSSNPRKPMMLSIAVAFAFAATFGGPMGEQLSQASQAEPVVTSNMIEDRFVRLIFPGHAHQHARRRLPLIVHLHGFSAFPGLVDRALDGTGYRALPGKYDVIVAAPMGTLHPQLEAFFGTPPGIAAALSQSMGRRWMTQASCCAWWRS